MAVDIGKSIAIARLTDGSVLSMFNNTLIGMETTVNFHDKDGPRYTMSIDQTAFTNKYRCAYYSRSLPQGSMDMTPHLILMLSSNSTVQPIYEFISPAITCIKQDMVQLSWWSNVEASKFNGSYDATALVRFSSSNLYVDTNIAAYKILCTATIRWEYLKQMGAGAGDANFMMVPIIDTPAIAVVIKNEGYVLDFETGTGGGGGGGLGIHSHTSNDDAGFAAAVFMPSAHIRPLNWR